MAVQIILNPPDVGEVQDVTDVWNTSGDTWLHYFEAIPYDGHTFSHWDVYINGAFVAESLMNPIMGDIRQAGVVLVANFDAADYSDTNGGGVEPVKSNLPLIAGLGILGALLWWKKRKK